MSESPTWGEGKNHPVDFYDESRCVRVLMPFFGAMSLEEVTAVRPMSSCACLHRRNLSNTVSTAAAGHLDLFSSLLRIMFGFVRVVLLFLYAGLPVRTVSHVSVCSQER